MWSKTALTYIFDFSLSWFSVAAKMGVSSGYHKNRMPHKISINWFLLSLFGVVMAVRRNATTKNARFWLRQRFCRDNSDVSLIKFVVLFTFCHLFKFNVNPVINSALFPDHFSLQYSNKKCIALHQLISIQFGSFGKITWLCIIEVKIVRITALFKFCIRNCDSNRNSDKDYSHLVKWSLFWWSIT